MLRFEKYQGTGNDFVIFEMSELDGLQHSLLAQKVCNRRFGIGADGMIVVAPSKVATMQMIFYNADGSINSEAYGTETNLPWKMGIVENGVEKFVHPTFLYESIGTVIIFIILTILQNKSKFEGQIAYTYLALYSLLRFFIEGLRADSLMLFNFRISQILSLIIFVLSIGIIVESISKSKRMSKNEEK